MSETEFRDPSAPKSPAIPQFFTDKEKMEFKSKQEGRPIFEEREFVRIIIPGDRRSIVVEPVSDEHKARWPKEYEAFKAGLEAPTDGTPLSDWPCSLLNTARVAELAYFNIKTVEQLAGVNDTQLQNLGMGSRELRDRAKKFLEVAANGTGPIEKMMAKIEDQAREIGRLTRELTEANAEITALKESANARAAA